MALTKQERAFIEKETNLSIKDWENKLCSNEGMLLIQGKVAIVIKFCLMV